MQKPVGARGLLGTFGGTMTITVFLVALAHGLPVYFLGLLTGSRIVLTIAAALATFIAFATGGASFLIFDLVAIAAACYFGYSHIQPKKPANKPEALPAPLPDFKLSSASNSLLGFVLLVVVGAVIYNEYTDKPSPPPPSISSRLDAFASTLRGEKFDTRFPLVQTRVQDNSLHVSFRATEQTATEFKRKFAKTNFAHEYSSYYCTSQVAGPLLREGARIVVSLSGKDAESVGTYEITKSSCDALTASPSTPSKATVDLPPLNAAKAKLVKSAFRGEGGNEEEAIYGAADHRVSEGGRGRDSGQGAVQEARLQ